MTRISAFPSHLTALTWVLMTPPGILSQWELRFPDSSIHDVRENIEKIAELG
jgi:hypothetical protein